MKKRSAFASNLIASAERGKVSETKAGSGMVGTISFLLRYFGQLPAGLSRGQR